MKLVSGCILHATRSIKKISERKRPVSKLISKHKVAVLFLTITHFLSPSLSPSKYRRSLGDRNICSTVTTSIHIGKGAVHGVVTSYRLFAGVKSL